MRRAVAAFPETNDTDERRGTRRHPDVNSLRDHPFNSDRSNAFSRTANEDSVRFRISIR